MKLGRIKSKSDFILDILVRNQTCVKAFILNILYISYFIADKNMVGMDKARNLYEISGSLQCL